jgi:hypothetical protein
MAWGISGSLPFLVLMQHFERVPKSHLCPWSQCGNPVSFSSSNDRGDSSGNFSALRHRVLFSPYQDFLGGPRMSAARVQAKRALVGVTENALVRDEREFERRTGLHFC